jgi:hypothetical protein
MIRYQRARISEDAQHVRVREHPLERLRVRNRGEDEEAAMLAVGEGAHAVRFPSARIRSTAARAI